MSDVYVCEDCRYEGKDENEVFKVPADSAGAGLMLGHLKEKHGV